MTPELRAAIVTDHPHGTLAVITMTDDLGEHVAIRSYRMLGPAVPCWCIADGWVLDHRVASVRVVGVRDTKAGEPDA